MQVRAGITKFPLHVHFTEEESSLIKLKIASWLRENNMDERDDIRDMVAHFLVKKGVKKGEIEVEMPWMFSNNLRASIPLPESCPLAECLEQVERMNTLLTDCVKACLAELKKLD